MNSRPIRSSSSVVIPGSMALPITSSVLATIRPICLSAVKSSSLVTVMSLPFAKPEEALAQVSAIFKEPPRSHWPPSGLSPRCPCALHRSQRRCDTTRCGLCRLGTSQESIADCAAGFALHPRKALPYYRGDGEINHSSKFLHERKGRQSAAENNEHQTHLFPLVAFRYKAAACSSRSTRRSLGT